MNTVVAMDQAEGETIKRLYFIFSSSIQEPGGGARVRGR
jgi:hypothetical protein